MNGSKRVKEADLRNPMWKLTFKCNIQFLHSWKREGESPAFLVNNNNKIMYLRHKSKQRNENRRASEGRDTFLQRTNKVRQPTLTRLRELVPPWPFRFHNQRQKNTLNFNRSTTVTADMQNGQWSMNVTNSYSSCCVCWAHHPKLRLCQHQQT